MIYEFLLTMTDSEFGIAIIFIYLYLSSSLIHSLSIEYRGMITRLAQNALSDDTSNSSPRGPGHGSEAGTATTTDW